ncbi:hypothetical protein ALC53_05458 [Atta colombica]|uniref:Ig-like domain-containing protein n=1 Tax=Atta colombica TaxID=520822 RepID=A0A151I439_9HYME|nr:hypothetical protein ALC53_05458 [Atta colombica]
MRLESLKDSSMHMNRKSSYHYTTVLNLADIEFPITKRDKHVNLLYLQDSRNDNITHFAWMKDLSHLVRSQITGNENRKYVIGMCLHYFSSSAKLEILSKDCYLNPPKVNKEGLECVHLSSVGKIAITKIAESFHLLTDLHFHFFQVKRTFIILSLNFLGKSAYLECQICISPLEMYMTSLIEWYFNSSSSSNNKSSKVKDVLYNGNRILEQAGAYWCEIGHTIGSIYYLHVDSNMETVNVYPDRAPYTLQATLKNVSEYKLKVYTTWTTWSSCSTCDTVGIKLRYGYCTVSLFEMSDNKSFINKRASIMNKLQHMKRDIKKVQLKTALMLFKNKLPCKSRFLPEQVRLIPVIKNKKIEIVRQYCKKKCRKDIIFEVRDKKGNILESANNSAGIFSMIQEMPKPLPSIARSVIYEKHNKKIELVCPGNLNADVPIVWRIDDKMIIPSHIKSQSNGRIHINPQMQILFEPLKFEDANIYSCWQNNEIAGIIKLIVIEEIEFKLNHHVILMGAIVIIVSPTFRIEGGIISGVKLVGGSIPLTSNPVKLLTVVVFDKGGTCDCDDGGAVTAMPISVGDLVLEIIMSFLLLGGINSGGSTLGIAYFSNALYTRCIACIITQLGRKKKKI